MTFELGTDGPTSVLVGVDGSRTSLRAAAYAGGLVRRQRARLIVAHVLAPSGLASLSPQAGALYRASQEETGQLLEREIRDAAGSVGLTAEFVHLTGDVYEQLVRLADERRVDAVVVGASEQAGHRLVGSLATRLVRTGRWPVTVVP
jgi:nucleotide-binding universal stress UspA family protein